MTSAANPAIGTSTTATATCSTGKLVGGGGRVTHTTVAQPGQIKQSYPSSATVWTVVGGPSVTNSGGATITVQAYALCVP